MGVGVPRVTMSPLLGRTKNLLKVTQTLPLKLSDTLGKLAGEKLLILSRLRARAKLRGATPRLFAKPGMTHACALKRLLTP